MPKEIPTFFPQEQMTTPPPLLSLPSGTSGEVIAIQSGKALKKRLHDLGLFIGSHIEILKNDGSGPLIIKTLESKIVLGRRECSKIFIS